MLLLTLPPIHLISIVVLADSLSVCVCVFAYNIYKHVATCLCVRVWQAIGAVELEIKHTHTGTEWQSHVCVYVNVQVAPSVPDATSVGPEWHSIQPCGLCLLCAAIARNVRMSSQVISPAPLKPVPPPRPVYHTPFSTT